jgi:hypothetical protein
MSAELEQLLKASIVITAQKKVISAQTSEIKLLKARLDYMETKLLKQIESNSKFPGLCRPMAG